MLLSPPFLLERLASETDEQWIDRCMSGGQPGDGAFPLSFNLGWHGGLHLISPMNGSQPEPVRAIADGTVVIVRPPSARPNGPLPAQHPQAYGRGWTDNGVIVLRHETEIGDGAGARVVFFSVYMHLGVVHPAVQSGRMMYRKTEIGVAGQVDGDVQRRLHFEIVCDDANLARLVGRSSGDLPTNADGRLDAVYGQMYFLLPTGAAFYRDKPLDNRAAAHIQPPKPSANAPLPPEQALQPAFTSERPLVIALRYAGGEGPEGHRGSAWLSTLNPDGTPIGEMPEELDAEYNLYKRATEISGAYPANAQPAPSAVYELLRFGRIVNTANEALTPADVPHWRKVAYAGGQGWVNLNAQEVRKFSDADFPHWQRWMLVDDSADQDSRCDSQRLKSLLDISSDGQVDPTEATARLSDPAVTRQMARSLCKFPTEWDASTVNQRWDWLKTSTLENPSPFTDADFELLRAHIQALAFLPGATGLPSSHWHFQPREFLKAFRKTAWLSTLELSQCLPRHSLSGTVSWETSHTRAETNKQSLNFYFRKFYFDNRQRIAHALCQIYIETGVLAVLNEGGSGNNKPYGPFFGRGYMQLTWAGNYRDYGDYKLLPTHAGSYSDPQQRITQTSTHPASSGGVNIRWFPKYDPEIVTTPHHAGESSGFFWITKRFKGRSNMNRSADLAFSPSIIGFNSWLINGGGNGYVHRQQFAKFLENILFDLSLKSGTQDFNYPPLTQLVNIGTQQNPQMIPLLCSAFPPPTMQYSQTGTINYEYQRP